MTVRISLKVKAKLQRKEPPVTDLEVEEAFFLQEGKSLQDKRYQGALPVFWFVSSTFDDRRLKIVYLEKNDDEIVISAYDADEDEENAYESKQI